MKKINRRHFSMSLVAFSFLIIACSCGSSKRVNSDYLYFKSGTDTVSMPAKKTSIQPYDILSVQVISRTLNQEQAAIFNYPAGKDGVQSAQGYQVNAAGNIEIPVIGQIKAAGLTLEELEVSLSEKLTNYVKNPGIIVRFLQFDVNVLGEVRNPGIQKFKTDKVTIIDALSSAGDLTDFGKREDVIVIREQYGKKITYKVDLRSRLIFESPVYYLQPNDIVYVNPNKYKIRSLDVDPSAQRRTGLLLSITSILLSIASIIVFANEN
jgi:polysaccharide export outer membrane protein